jgi:hypothetical protein
MTAVGAERGKSPRRGGKGAGLVPAVRAGKQDGRLGLPSSGEGEQAAAGGKDRAR